MCADCGANIDGENWITYMEIGVNLKMNNDPDKELDSLCDDVATECREYYKCAADSDCKESGGVYRLASMACTMPEGKECL